MVTQQVSRLRDFHAKQKSPQFTSLEEKLDSVVDDNNAELLDGFIRIAVGRLSDKNPHCSQFANFFRQVHPSLSARYLVGALANLSQEADSLAILKSYGASRHTVRPLVHGLADPRRVHNITDILAFYGPSKDTVFPLIHDMAYPELVTPVKNVFLRYGPSRHIISLLVNYLDDHVRAPHIKEVLLDYGPSEFMVGHLINALGYPNMQQAASEILISFGRTVLPFIHHPSRMSGVYRQVTQVLSEIPRRGA